MQFKIAYLFRSRGHVSTGRRHRTRGERGTSPRSVRSLTNERLGARLGHVSLLLREFASKEVVVGEEIGSYDRSTRTLCFVRLFYPNEISRKEGRM